MNRKNALCHRLVFRPLSRHGRAYAFPCDENGNVDLNLLGERARNDYLYARAMMGRELSTPVVEESASPGR